MVMLNDLDRFHLVIDVIDRVPGLTAKAAGLRQFHVRRRLRYRAWTREYGDDHPEVRDWAWASASGRPAPSVRAVRQPLAHATPGCDTVEATVADYDDVALVRGRQQGVERLAARPIPRRRRRADR